MSPHKKYISKFYLLLGLLTSTYIIASESSLKMYCDEHFTERIGTLRPKVESHALDCFISYSCGYDKQLMTQEERQQRAFVDRLVNDLKLVGIIPDYDLDNLPIGSNIDTFLDKIFQTKCVVLLFSKRFKKQCEEDLNSGAAKELKRILKRKENLRGDCCFLTPILLDGEPEECIPAHTTLPNHIYIKLKSNNYKSYYEMFFEILEHKLLDDLKPPGLNSVDVQALRYDFNEQLKLYMEVYDHDVSEIDSEGAQSEADRHITFSEQKFDVPDYLIKDTTNSKELPKFGKKIEVTYSPEGIKFGKTIEGQICVIN